MYFVLLSFGILVHTYLLPLLSLTSLNETNLLILFYQLKIINIICPRLPFPRVARTIPHKTPQIYLELHIVMLHHKLCSCHKVYCNYNSRQEVWDSVEDIRVLIRHKSCRCIPVWLHTQFLAFLRLQKE